MRFCCGVEGFVIILGFICNIKKGFINEVNEVNEVNVVII